jgi:hypothetical protein
MTFDQIPYDLAAGILHWLVAFLAVSATAFFVGVVFSLIAVGVRGPGLVWATFTRGVNDLLRLSARRIGAVASLTVKESLRKKALAVLVVFIVLFLMAGFFLRSPDASQDMPAKPFIAFVLTTIRWMCLPVALLLACWGLPTDIKDRSLHTVVTKPVRRSEVVIGRILGYCLITTMFVGLMSVVGYVFIIRSVPERSKEQLVSRVPLYGTLVFRGRDGELSYDQADPTRNAGVNVGDMWTFRSYIEGGTKGSATWTFKNLPVEQLKNLGDLRLENRFEAFRTFKGRVDEPVRYRLTLVNEKKGLRVSNADLVKGVAEFSAEMLSRKGKSEDDAAATSKPEATAVVTIPRKLSYVDVSANSTEARSVDLYDDVFDGNDLTIEAICLDPEQYLGAAASDLFIRLPDRSFASTYFKSIFCLWMMLMLVCLLGGTASCFVKGPVATLLTFSLVILGEVLRPGMDELLKQFEAERKVLGGGVLESLYRIVTQMNQTQELPDNVVMRGIQAVDRAALYLLDVLRNVIPNFNYFDTAEYSANGFDVSWATAVLPSLATMLAYIIPCILIGYFSLQLRELEAK